MKTDFTGKMQRMQWNYTELDYNAKVQFTEHQFSSVAQSCTALCNPMDCSTPGFPVHHQLPELTQTHVSVSNAIQPSHKSIKVSKSSSTEHSRAFCSVSSRDLGILEFKFKPSKDIPWESQVITHQKLPMGEKGGGHVQIRSWVKRSGWAWDSAFLRSSRRGRCFWPWHHRLSHREGEASKRMGAVWEWGEQFLRKYYIKKGKNVGN